MSDKLSAWGISPSESIHSFDLTPDDVDRCIPHLKFNRLLDVREGRYLKYGDDINKWHVPYDVFWTCHVSLPKSVFVSIGGFDSSFNSWGGEDFELAVRLHGEGVNWNLHRECMSIHMPHEHEIDNDKGISNRIEETLNNVCTAHNNIELQLYLEALKEGSDVLDVNGYAFLNERRILECA